MKNIIFIDTIAQNYHVSNSIPNHSFFDGGILTRKYFFFATL